MGAVGELTPDVANTLRISYTTDRPDSEVKLGAFAQIAAKRRFGLDVMKSGDPEAMLFAAFVEIEGAAKAKDDEAFDPWLQTVAAFDVDKDEEDDPSDPSPAESPGTSPASPPI